MFIRTDSRVVDDVAQQKVTYAIYGLGDGFFYLLNTYFIKSNLELAGIKAVFFY